MYIIIFKIVLNLASLVAESYSSAPTTTRNPAGVAVLANIDNLHKLRSVSLLEFPCINGYFILLAVYVYSSYLTLTSSHMLPSLLMATRFT